MDADEAEELLYAASQSRQNTSAFASLLFYAFVVLVLLVVTLACLLLRQRRDTESDARPDDDTVQQFSSMLNISPADAERMLTEMKTSKPSVIEKRLLLGNAACSADREALREARVAYIVNATSDLPNHCAADNIEYLRVPVEDALDADLLAYLDIAVDFLARALSDPYACGSVLVHCQQGVSRSATIVIAYLIRERGHTFRSALAHVQQRRFIRPNEALLKQLAEYEGLIRMRRDEQLSREAREL